MGRSISQATSAGVNVLSSTINPSGVFGSGKVEIYGTSSTFVVPAGVTSVRVRCFGGGGGGADEYTSGGAGGTSSFGAYVSATGGARGSGRSYNNEYSYGGTGVGGDINHTGGNGGSTNDAAKARGAGGVASYFGNGGHGAWNTVSSQNTLGGNSTGGAGGGGCIKTSGGSTAGGNGMFSPGSFEKFVYNTEPGAFVPSQHPQGQGWSPDIYGTGGGGTNSVPGINGGGGGTGMRGAFPGGGGGAYYGSGGGGGFAMKTITGLTPGDSIAVTAGVGGYGGASTNPAPPGAPGLVIVEY